MRIKAESIRLTDGGAIAADTFFSGEGTSISIDAESLLVEGERDTRIPQCCPPEITFSTISSTISPPSSGGTVRKLNTAIIALIRPRNKGWGVNGFDFVAFTVIGLVFVPLGKTCFKCGSASFKGLISLVVLVVQSYLSITSLGILRSIDSLSSLAICCLCITTIPVEETVVIGMTYMNVIRTLTSKNTVITNIKNIRTDEEMAINGTDLTMSVDIRIDN